MSGVLRYECSIAIACVDVKLDSPPPFACNLLLEISSGGLMIEFGQRAAVKGRV